MKKMIVALSSLIICCMLSVQDISVSVAEETISETEAKRLIFAASNFYMTYHYGKDDPVYYNNVEPITSTKETVANEARGIYLEEIADDMWMYPCEYFKRQDGQYSFSENSDGTITFDERFIMFVRQYRILSDYSSSAWYKQLLSSENCIELRNLNGDGDKGSAEVKVYKSSESLDEGLGKPVWIDVQYVRTDDGWRISGGSLVYAFSDWSNQALDCVPYYDYQFLSVIDAAYMIDTVMYTHSPGDYYVLSQDFEEEYFDFDSFALLYTNNSKCEYIIRNKKNMQSYNAVFTFDPDYQVTYGDKVYTGEWFLTGGGWYDLATGKENVAPYTGESGDFTGSVITMSIIAVLSFCFSTMLVVRRKRKADLSL